MSARHASDQAATGEARERHEPSARHASDQAATGEAPASRPIGELPVEECMTLLGTASVGRIAFVRGSGVVIRPVNYVFDRGTVVYRTAYGDTLDALADGVTASFEVDEVNPEERTGWSVLVQGRAEEVTDPVELMRLRELGLVPWAEGRREHYVRILPGSITGRRIG